MKRLVSATISVAFALFTSAQFSCTPQNANTTAAANRNTAVAEATPDRAAIEKELRRIENDWPRIMKERDGQAVERIDADDAYLLSWDGSVSTKDEDVKGIEAGNISAEGIEEKDIKVRVLDKDTAVVTGTIAIKNGKDKEGDQTADVSGEYRWVDTFARRNGQWKVVASASVKASAAALAASPTRKTPPAP
jgi:ketosteroid isomerase-like protein